MVLWLILFLLIITISFLLAFRSMRDYHELPHKSKEEYGLFLIRRIGNFDNDTLSSLRKLMHQHDLIISMERLFKGKQAALTIFGPKKILAEFTDKLNLLELEDYAVSLDSKDVFTWEVGVKEAKKLNPEDISNLFKDLPELHEEDQFFWQVILAPKGKPEDLSFHTQIRAAFLSKDPQRRKIFAPLLQNFHGGKLFKVPKPYTPNQMTSFYQLRSLSQDSRGPVLTSHGVANLIKI